MKIRTLLPILALLWACAQTGPSRGPGATVPDQVAAVEQQMLRDLAALEVTAAETRAPDCERARLLGQNICGLAERICALVQRDATIPDGAARCHKARQRCQDARQRVDKRCGPG